jgi:nitrogen fixation-related uncharacterized protein
MTKALIAILCLTAGFATSAVWGLAWAARTGQLSRPNATARSIFDDDEPVGRVTDAFPGQESGPERENGDKPVNAPIQASTHAPAKEAAKR